MKTLHITLTWNTARQEWDMKIGGHFIQEFHDCATVNNAFNGLDKSKINKFAITIENDNS